HARIFFATLQMLRLEMPASSATDSRVRIGPSQTARAADEGLALAAALAAAESDMGVGKDVPEEVLALARRAHEVRDDLNFLLRADDPSFVYFLEIRGRGVYLRGAPVYVPDIIREVLLERMTALVLTSATLTADGSFEYLRGRLGIRH